MSDVAEVMGVSTTTVSNAFSRPDQLSPELRDRILTRAAKMGYYGPHVAGRVLKQGHANAYGVVFMDTLSSAFDDPFKLQWLAGFSDEIRIAGASLVLMAVAPDLQASAQALRNTLVDGIAVTWATHPIMSMARSQGLPVVAGGPHGPCYVTIDEHAAGREMGDHLRSMGHEQVCIVTGPVARPAKEPDITTWDHYVTNERPQGPWPRLTGLVEGLEPSSAVIAQATSWTRAAGAEATAAALQRLPHVTAFACAGDQLAVGVLDMIQSHGRTPGKDLAITGFDGTLDAATHGLTTVDARAREQGSRAAQLLLNPDLHPRQAVLDHHLVIRGSSSSRLSV
ncbi:LacI family DNA-binding transcriptional regulator [Luteococcus sp. Sow4_B9]|uniref:LacI family DNA-binding transcriptional regulator n=1 Tax=Luteococcus sp. Sow4_B9 TaxID=3438792 RepID=UPI003F9C1006